MNASLHEPASNPFEARLNPQQYRAATHGFDSASGFAANPLLIIAGAGTGKTNTLAHRVAHLLLKGVAPDRILLLTFTRRAAQEMLCRAERIAKETMRQAGRSASAPIDTARLLWSGTYHSIGNRLLREYAQVVGLEHNYRCVQPILDAANALIGDSPRQYRKQLRSDRLSNRKPAYVAVQDDQAQALYVVEQVLAAREQGTLLRRQAVLMRSSHHSDVLERLSARYATREQFITELTLDPPQVTSDLAGEPLLDEDYLILSTVHSAKGQEWDSVYVLNVSDGNFPNEHAAGRPDLAEEERRLLYVAVTRTKHDLHLIAPLKYYITQQSRTGDAHVYGARSRFITDALLSYFEQKAWPASAESSMRAADARTSVRVDAAAALRAMWD